MKNGVFLIILVMASMVLSCTATPTFSATPSEDYHIPHVMAKMAGNSTGQPCMFGWMDANGGSRFGVEKTSVTVSFPETDLSAIQSDNWLAGGMWVRGSDSELDQTDYQYFTMLLLRPEIPNAVQFQGGVFKFYEGLTPGGPPPSSELLYINSWLFQGIDISTPFTLTASFNASTGVVSWEISYYSAAWGRRVTWALQPFNITAVCPTVIRSFVVGTATFDWKYFWIKYKMCYYYQFGVLSDYNIGHGGWNVLLSFPSYFKDGEWHVVEAANSIGGENAFLDARWTTGGEDYEGVNADYYPSLRPYCVKFYYSGSTLEDNTPLWWPLDLTVFAKDQYGNILTTGDVYIDDQWCGFTTSTFIAEPGTHTVRTNDFWESRGAGYRYGLTYWEAPYNPPDDSWTESTDCWYGDSLRLDSINKKVGQYSIMATRYTTLSLGLGSGLAIGRTHIDSEYSYSRLHFWLLLRSDGWILKCTVFLIEDYSNYFYREVDYQVGWIECSFDVGPSSSGWSTWGNPHWSEVNEFRVGDVVTVDSTYRSINIDGMYFTTPDFENTTFTAYFNKSETPCLGDCNGDGVVNELDIDIVLAAWFSGRYPEEGYADPKWDSRADVDCDGFIDIDDYATVAINLDYCLLTVLAEDQYGSLTTVDVYIDDEFVGNTGSTFTVMAGTRKVFVSDGLFQYWVEDGSTDNPRTMWLVEDTTIKAHFYNLPPDTPSTPSGPTSGYSGTSYTYSTSTTDPDGDKVCYLFYWDDGSITATGHYASGVTVSASHSWSSPGTYKVWVRAQDVYGGTSHWSQPLTVNIRNPGLGWVSPTGHNDPGYQWTGESRAYDDDLATNAYTALSFIELSSFLHLTLTSAITCDTIRIYCAGLIGVAGDYVDIDVYKDGVWTHVFKGIPPWNVWYEIGFSEGQVSEVRIRAKNNSKFYVAFRVYEFDFWRS